MYTIRTEQSFDSAHFLAGYEGKCSNLHGHRWRVAVEVCADSLREKGQLRGMVADFGDVRRDLKELAEAHDHAFLYEKGTLREDTVRALKEEGFLLIDLPFRPTAENFAKYFFDLMTKKGYEVYAVEVYETPNNCARYAADLGERRMEIRQNRCPGLSGTGDSKGIQ